MSTQPPADFLELQTALKGRYSIDRELGRGGMGIVYLAHEVALDRPVALKLLPPEMAVHERLRERFLREARTAAKLSHPNIVPIFAVDEVDGFVFFAMAFIEGETLGERIRARGPLPAGEAVKVLREVAWALAYAHGQGIVHRDIKPDNILLEKDSGRALVMDFGIAHVGHEQGMTSVGEVLGTAEVMSPEQASGDEIDARSDIYSLGAVGFYALTGRFPFEGSSVSAVLAKQISQAPPPVASVAPEIPASLANAVDRCLRKGPVERFPDGAALAEALGQGVQVVRELPVPLRVFIKRMRNVGTASAGMILVGLYLFLGTLGPVSEGLLVAALPAVLLFALAVLGPAGLATYNARMLLKSGYGLSDAQLALRQDVERRREELTFEYGPYPARLDRTLMWSAVGGLGMAAGSAALLVWATLGGAGILSGLSEGILGSLLGISSVGGLLTGVWWSSRRKRRKDVAGEAWSKRLKGWIGSFMFKAGSVGLRLPAASGGGFRPTELAIGMAADRLFEDLPKETRKELAGLPEAIRKLESDAQGMRQQVEELGRVLAEIGDDPGRAGADERAKLREDLEATRDAAKGRMTDAVSALESIRLGLLRLHAGAGSVASVTADLTAALGISDDIERLRSGQVEVEKLLGQRFPRTRPPQ